MAQKKGYAPGYIVTLEGDTLRGWVMDRREGSFQALYDKIRFIKEGKKRRKKYAPWQIAGYRFNDVVFESVFLQEEMVRFVNRYYVNRPGEQIFLKLIKRNELLTLYEREFIFDDGDFIDSFPLLYKNGSDEMVRATQGLLGLKKKRLAEYFSDCSPLINKINAGEIKTVDGIYQYYSDQCN